MDKPKSVYIIIFNGFTALSLCIVAQLLAIVHNTAPFFSLSRLGINFLVAYPCPHTRFAGQKNNLYNGKG